ncbi:isochorismatase family protein [Rhodococcus sp. BGS-1C]|jgi:nicotinamidase/pyrazinamidase|uniref:isochorismatase family protein n=1 Tax=unclassified Rhodococcus (in: high G+C Gram-positive bacteria) TaxID=192944 RepID=UPI0019D1463C|nr:isochorismatase family protein [Rhodococcus sp. KRD197]
MTRALLVVDVQNDFTEGGALGIEGGGEIARKVSVLLAKEGDEYDLVVSSRDWHDGDNDNGGHFAVDAAPDFNTTWPVHCVAGTKGAEYHPDYVTGAVDVHVYKGQGKPSYSAFQGITDEGITLPEVLRRNEVTDIDLVGLATDFCVKASGLDALSLGLNVRILTAMVAGVAAESSDASLSELRAAGATLI